jgi:hypothetical protein
MDVTIALVDPISKDTITVSAGRVQGVKPWICPETGVNEGQVSFYYHGVSIRTGYGIEYTHSLLADDSVEGAIQAARLATRVASKIAKVGVDAALGHGHWADRVIYGSPAYSADEHNIVQREKDDCLLNGG